MNRKDLYNSFNEIDDQLLERSESYKTPQKITWLRWSALVACFCVVIIGIAVWSITQTHQNTPSGTLPGAEEIYPTVMVDGELYEWHKGAAICNELPEGNELYGVIKHITKEIPESNCEFASVFDAEGEIYTVSGSDSIYLKLTTSWLDNVIVKFDLVKQTN